MSKSAKRNKISSLGLFYILFICRVAVSLTSVHSVSKSEFYAIGQERTLLIQKLSANFIMLISFLLLR